MEVSKDEREKAKATAFKILTQFQNDGLTTKEVHLITFWLCELAKDSIEKNVSKHSFLL